MASERQARAGRSKAVRRLLPPSCSSSSWATRGNGASPETLSLRGAFDSHLLGVFLIPQEEVQSYAPVL